MKARRFCRGLQVALSSSLVFAYPQPEPAGEERLNVLLIVIDDLNDWVGCLGGRPGVHTPYLDELARRGVLFTNAHTSAPSCNPSRASFMTGIRPSTSGIYNNAPHWRSSPVLAQVQTLPEHFRTHGYRVMGGGKIFHALSWTRRDGGDGFNDAACWDEYFPSFRRAMPDEERPVPASVVPGEGFWRHDLLEVWEPVVQGKAEFRPPWFFDWAPLQVADEETADHQVVDWAVSRLGRTYRRPFFLAVGIYRPHIPWYVPQKYFDLYPLQEVRLPEVQEGWMEQIPPYARQLGAARKKWHQWVVERGEWAGAIQAYLASVSFADFQVGRLLRALDSSPHSRNTVVVLFSDHGFHLGEKENWEKFTLWEESTRVPLIFLAPGVTRPGGRSPVPASLLDLYPTLVELCRLDSPPT